MSNETYVLVAGICACAAAVCGILATRRWPTIYLGFSLVGYLFSLAACALLVVALVRS